MSNTPKGKMTLPTTKPNRLDIEWYVQECAWMQVELGKLKTENAALLRLIEDPNAMHAHYLRHLPGWEVWSTERVRNMDRDNARLERENAALRSRCEELESERTQFSNRAARLSTVEHELEESRKAERLARVQLQAEREARK